MRFLCVFLISFGIVSSALSAATRINIKINDDVVNHNNHHQPNHGHNNNQHGANNHRVVNNHHTAASSHQPVTQYIPPLSPLSGPLSMQSLAGRCFHVQELHYDYRFCPFHNITQTVIPLSSQTGYQPEPIVLGRWGQWKDVQRGRYMHMHYSNGLRCGTGTIRTATILMHCGAQHSLSTFSEPSHCVYVASFTCPEACASATNAASPSPMLSSASESSPSSTAPAESVQSADHLELTHSHPPVHPPTELDLHSLGIHFAHVRSISAALDACLANARNSGSSSSDQSRAATLSDECVTVLELLKVAFGQVPLLAHLNDTLASNPPAAAPSHAATSISSSPSVIPSTSSSATSHSVTPASTNQNSPSPSPSVASDDSESAEAPVRSDL